MGDLEKLGVFCKGFEVRIPFPWFLHQFSLALNLHPLSRSHRWLILIFLSSRILLILLYFKFSVQLLKPLPRLYPSDRSAKPRANYASDLQNHHVK